MEVSEQADIPAPAEPELAPSGESDVVESPTETPEEVDPDQALLDQLDTGSPDEVSLSDVEYEGKQYQLPPELKDALLRQSDYTKKTQDVAEQRKEVAEQVQQFQQSQAIQQQFVQDREEVGALNYQLQQYEQVDWNLANQQNPQEAQAAFMQMQQLQQQRDRKTQELNAKQNQAVQHQQSQIAQLKEKGLAKLAEVIPDWSDTVKSDVLNYAKDQGFSQQELAQIYDPRAVQMLDKARRYDQLVKKAGAMKKPQTVEVKPTTKVRGGKSGKKTLADAKSTDDFIAMRNAQLARNKP